MTAPVDEEINLAENSGSRVSELPKARAPLAKQDVLFDERFLDRYAGTIITDASIAIVELVANAWDAYATEVSIVWPARSKGTKFSITDNGKGMTSAEFEKRWKTLDYNRLRDEGAKVAPPPELKDFPPRVTYGRNGKGRHAAFRFSDPYQVRTWRDGTDLTFEVRRGVAKPFERKLLRKREGVSGHGTEVSATSVEMTVGLGVEEARQIIGTRFLADPNFNVFIDGALITFEDVPRGSLQETKVEVPGFGVADLYMIDTQKTDRTTHQHGIAWRVNRRLVGNFDWTGFYDERILDGRTREARRFTFIVSADFLDDAVLPDWTDFNPTHEAWKATRELIHDKIKEFLHTHSAERRQETKRDVKQSLGQAVGRLPPVGRDRWNQFVDAVVDSCPTISADEVQQVAGILANLELSTSKYGLIGKLHDLPPGDLDQLHQILSDWTVRTARIALDEIQNRLKLIAELDRKLRDESMDEVQDLQPLFERSLWVFGPEFESIEFTSNKGMTTVIRELFGAKDVTGPRLRPDFVILPDGSVGFYTRDSHDLGHEVAGVSRLVIAEIKKAGITIGSEQKDQAWKYVKALENKGLLQKTTVITCFVLGRKSRQPRSATEQSGKGESRFVQCLTMFSFEGRKRECWACSRN